MLSKKNLKFIQSLRYKKQRDNHRQFIVEGDKVVKDLMNSDWEIPHLFATPEWLSRLLAGDKKKPGQITELSDRELKKISTLKIPNHVLAVVMKPEYSISWEEIASDLTLFLEEIQDPGNLGTILRIAAWFGIKNVCCSKATADIYNPKVVQASMGALLWVKVHYIEPVSFLRECSARGIPVYGTYLDGKNIYGASLVKNGLVVLGNESRGISGDCSPFVTEKISIPGFGSPGRTIESLNVAVAAAIVCSEFRRRVQ
jgi:TrmH family RNA methyltransferase